MAYEVLQSAIRPLSSYYLKEGIEEIAINRPGEVWVRLRGKRAHPWVMEEAPHLTREYLLDIMHIVANTFGLDFDPDHGTPVVYATLPGDHRFTAAAGKNVMYDADDMIGGVCMCIRQHSNDVDFDFSDYGLVQGSALHRPTMPQKNDSEDPTDPFERLMLSLKRGDHVLVSGATATGKTTFLNNLLKTIDPELRIVTVEDTRELLVPQPNHVHVVLSRTDQTNRMTYARVIDLCVRLTPDAIIGGEVSTANAGALWELMGSGHGHCYATIHAESPEAAYKAFADRIMHTYPSIDRKQVIEEMRERLRVVQINREGNMRAVTEVT